MSSSAARRPAPEGPGSVSGAPNLLAGFAGTFTSRYVNTGELRFLAPYRDGPAAAHNPTPNAVGD